MSFVKFSFAIQCLRLGFASKLSAGGLQLETPLYTIFHRSHSWNQLQIGIGIGHFVSVLLVLAKVFKT